MKNKSPLCGLISFVVLFFTYCTGKSSSSGATKDTTELKPTTSTTVYHPTKLEKLKSDLELVNTEIVMEQGTYNGCVGDAATAMRLSLDPTIDDEKKELYKERVKTSQKCADESQIKLNELNSKKGSIEAQLSELKEQ